MAWNYPLTFDSKASPVALGWEDLLVKGNGNPLQYSRLENSMDRGAWRATVHGVAKSQAVVATHSGKQTHSEGQCR